MTSLYTPTLSDSQPFHTCHTIHHRMHAAVTSTGWHRKVLSTLIRPVDIPVKADYRPTYLQIRGQVCWYAGGLFDAFSSEQCGMNNAPVRPEQCSLSETIYHRDDALLYIAYVMLIWAAPIPADRWHCSLWP